MGREKIKYKKLCSAMLNSIVGGRQQVMICDDHILVAKKLAMREGYRRFFLKDIKKMTAYKTMTGWISLIFEAAALVLFVFFAVMANKFDGSNVPFAIFATLAIVALTILLIDVFKGPTGKVLITTLNSSEALAFTNRFNQDVRILKRIRPMVEAAQGGTRNETVDRLMGLDSAGEEPSSDNA